MSLLVKLFETMFPVWWFGPKAVKALDAMKVGMKSDLYRGKDVMIKVQYDRDGKKYFVVHLKKLSADRSSFYWYYDKFEVVDDTVEGSNPIRNTDKALKLVKQGKYPDSFNVKQ